MKVESYTFEPGTVLEDCDGDRWVVNAVGAVRNEVFPGFPSVVALAATYGPLVLVGDTDEVASTGGRGVDVALMGRAGAGKDTVAALLAEEKGHVRVAFADPLKEMALAIDPLIYSVGSTPSIYRLSYLVDELGWEEAKRDYPEVRRFLQRLGAEGVRDVIGPDTWLNLAERKIQRNLASGKPVALTDVRFPNEVAMARRMGFRLLWISRPGVEDGEHASESAIGPDDADVVVVNDGSRDALLARVLEAIGCSAARGTGQNAEHDEARA